MSKHARCRFNRFDSRRMCYVITGKTYPLRDELRERGFRCRKDDRTGEWLYSMIALPCDPNIRWVKTCTNLNVAEHEYQGAMLVLKRGSK